MDIKELIETIRKSYYNFYCKTGKNPNYIVISVDLFEKLKALGIIICSKNGEQNKIMIYGCELMVVIGENTVKAALIDG